MNTTWDWQNATITAVFAEQVRARPDATALRFCGVDMSYSELDRRAEDLARRLRTLGVGPESVVGVCFERSFEMIVALVAIVKAGGAYLPLHPDDPAPRLRFMLDQTGARVLLTHEHVVSRLPELEQTVVSTDGTSLAEISPDRGPLPDNAADSAAYVCYTSGSTGEPKGVLVPHRGVTRLVRSGDYADLGPDETFLQLCALTFDPAAFEIWGALLNGGRLVVYRPGPLSLSELADCVEAEKISTLWLTTGLFHRMVDGHLDGLGGLRQLLAGGDVLSPKHINQVRRTHPHVRMINGYGPTENTCFTTCHTVTRPVGGSVPIGLPITGTRTYVLDENLSPVPDGEWGLLYTAGAGLARGYVGRPGLTADRFIADPFVSGERMYSVGDVVRRGADGVIEFRGRNDDQVKVGGYRVELGEIVAALAGLTGVKEAVVVVRHDLPPRDKVLVAYVVPEYRQHDSLATELRLSLYQRLPRHMIPGAIVVLDSFPLTRNGKVDRAALPAPQLSPREVDTVYEAPRTPIEALLADLVSDALAVKEIGVHDDFFDIGGNSLIAADLLARIRSSLSVDIPAAQLFFENPTVAGLAEMVEVSTAARQAEAAEDDAVAQPIRLGGKQ
ncbi:amino acid adenylation domain-containing protein [Lentzea sp. JNUCC 0626]|uniref:amino acid adenylation domain-containing protein n=1 Tax=Lentzea sp. JNUCC 0626 TaxID=3367513 RepID=UPI003747DA65